MGKTREAWAPVHRGPKKSAQRPSWLLLSLITVGAGGGVVAGGGAAQHVSPPPRPWVSRLPIGGGPCTHSRSSFIRLVRRSNPHAWLTANDDRWLANRQLGLPALLVGCRPIPDSLGIVVVMR